MRTRATLRYVVALLVRTQRWAPPAIVLVGLIAWIWVTPPLGADTIRICLLVLFGLGAWLGHAAGSVEEAGQEQVSASCRGSASGLLLAKWGVAAVLAATPLLVPVLVTFTIAQLTPGSARSVRLAAFTPALTGAAACATLGVAAAAAACGLLASSLLPGRPGWATAALVLLTLAQAIPGGVPVAAFSAALSPGQDGLLPGLGGAALLTAAGVLLARVFRRPAG